MNWGKGITIVMIAFIGFIITLVTILMSNKIDLVSEDYYQKEINFEDEIASSKNWKALGKELAFQTNEQHIIVTLPEIDQVNEFELFFTRPDDIKQDLAFKINGTKTYIMDKSKFEKGQYDFRLECSNGQKTYLKKGTYYVK
jgi:nitrogen fixation protein FixH